MKNPNFYFIRLEIIIFNRLIICRIGQIKVKVNVSRNSQYIRLLVPWVESKWVNISWLCTKFRPAVCQKFSNVKLCLLTMLWLRFKNDKAIYMNFKWIPFSSTAFDLISLNDSTNFRTKCPPVFYIPIITFL